MAGEDIMVDELTVIWYFSLDQQLSVWRQMQESSLELRRNFNPTSSWSVRQEVRSWLNSTDIVPVPWVELSVMLASWLIMLESKLRITLSTSMSQWESSQSPKLSLIWLSTLEKVMKAVSASQWQDHTELLYLSEELMRRVHNCIPLIHLEPTPSGRPTPLAVAKRLLCQLSKNSTMLRWLLKRLKRWSCKYWRM